jgi:cell division septation protein DedD
MAKRNHGRRFGTLFVIIGVVAILGTTFAAGFLSGRHWERVRVVAGLVKPQAGKEPTRERAGALRPAEPPPMPSMTFYQELTAPLASPPPRPVKSPAPKAQTPAKEEAPRADVAAKADLPAKQVAKLDAAPAKSETVKPSTAATSADTAGRSSGYTVQVAAYATREQADALVARLGTRGFHADVSETTTPGGVRYRVRVGTYATKEAAKDVIARLSTDSGLSGFVTVR